MKTVTETWYTLWRRVVSHAIPTLEDLEYGDSINRVKVTEYWHPIEGVKVKSLEELMDNDPK